MGPIGNLPDVTAYFQSATDALTGAVEQGRQLEQRVEPLVPTTPQEALDDVQRLIAFGIQESNEPIPHAIIEAAKRAFGYLTSDETKGTSIGVDDFQHPHDFGYGTKKQTLWEGDLVFSSTRPLKVDPGFDSGTETDAVGAKQRFFGSASRETLSASLGSEYEAGLMIDAQEKGTDSQGRDNVANANLFVGDRGRVYGEAGILGATVGAESFTGIDFYTDETFGTPGEAGLWYRQKFEWSAGLGGAGSLHAGITGFSASVHEEFGMRYRGEIEAHLPVAYGVGVYGRENGTLFIGQEATAEAAINPMGAKVGIDGFVGIKAIARTDLGLTFQGHELGGAFLQSEGRVGFGVTAMNSYGWDWKTHSFHAEAEYGAALGVGGAIGGGITLGGKDFDKSKEGSQDLTEEG